MREEVGDARRIGDAGQVGDAMRVGSASEFAFANAVKRERGIASGGVDAGV
jgi:hypothetical protein